MNKITNFDHLTVPEIKKSFLQVLTREWYLENALKYWLYRFFLSNFFLRKISKKFYHFFLNIDTLAHNRDEIDRNIKNLEKDRQKQEHVNPAAFGSEYGYSDEIPELMCVVKYKEQIEKGLTKDGAESGALYDACIDHLSALFEKDKSIDTFLNFGVGYGHIDNILAQKFPHIRFIGLDRSSLTKHFNERDFGKTKNLEFVADDVFEFLSKNNFKNAVFFSARTMLMLPKSFVEKIYTKAHDVGFKYITGFEQLGISRQTGKPYQFSLEPRESVAYRYFMITHNYPGLLSAAGYDVTEAELIQTNHPHADYRILHFLGKKKSS